MAAVWMTEGETWKQRVSLCILHLEDNSFGCTLFFTAKCGTEVTMKTRRIDTKMLVTLGMLSALSYIVMYFFRIPISTVDFLKYDPKDIPIVIAGFLYGPMASFAISAVVSVIEMVTASTTGPIGLIMNVLSTCAFACTAAAIYKRRQTLGGAAVGLAVGTVAMTAIMLLWNYFITPLYLGFPREAVAAMLIPVFLPFNLIKAGMNSALTMLLYKPVVVVLRKMGFVPPHRETLEKNKSMLHPGVILVSALVLATCILFVLVLKGII